MRSRIRLLRRARALFEGRGRPSVLSPTHGLAALGLAAVWVAGLAGILRLDFGLLLACGAVAALWLAARRLWPVAMIVAAALAPLAYALGAALPETTRQIAALEPGTHVRVRGVVRDRAVARNADGARLWLLLGEPEVEAGGRRWRPLDLEVELDAPFGARLRGLWRRDIRIGGGLSSIHRAGARARLALRQGAFHLDARPIDPDGSEVLRARLSARAGYYLSAPTLAVYEPIVLGVRDARSPEAREVVDAFRRVGIAHLFAISGLHIGLLFAIFLGAAHLVQAAALRGQGWLHGRAAGRLAALAATWGYVALIGFPVPAVRAAVMGTLLIWSGLWGTRTARWYTLWLAGLVLLAHTPSALYDISFQLSFLAVLFLLIGLAFHFRHWSAEPPAGTPHWLWRGVSLSVLNLTLTFFITLGIWPVIALAFGQISFLVFLGNLLMIPILSVVVLPSGLAGLAASLAMQGEVPGGWAERFAFGWLEAVLRAWVALVQWLDGAGGLLVVRADLNWGAPGLFLYYGLLAAALVLAWEGGREGRWRRILRRVGKNLAEWAAPGGARE